MDLSAAKANLKPTTTVVRTLPITGKPKPRCGVIDENDIEEIVEELEVLQQKAEKFVELLKNAKHCVVYTGAGVSTSADIPDYRGPQGIWTKKEKGESMGEIKFLDEAKPSFGHMALSTLLNRGYIHHVVSTNVDGLHIRSGVPLTAISELHGNIYKEVCNSCNKAYYRSFDVLGRVKKRFTGRLCEVAGCHGKLMDSIVNFGDYLPEQELECATKESKMADLTIILGTSMRIAPANKLPQHSYSKGHPLILVNLQKTPFDDVAGLRIFGHTDFILKLVTDQLQVEVPKYNISGDILQSQSLVSTTLKLKNLTQNTSEEHIKEIFSNFGKIEHLFIGHELSNTYCYITYKTPEETEKAVASFNGGQIDGNKIECNLVVGKIDWEFEKRMSNVGLAMDDDEPLPNSILNEIAGFNLKKLKKVETKDTSSVVLSPENEHPDQ